MKTSETKSARSVDPAVFVSFGGGEPVITHAGSHRRFRASADTLMLLAAAADRSGRLWARLVEDYGREAVERGVATLVEVGVLGDAHDVRPAERWADWGPEAWFVHRMTRDLPYGITEEEHVRNAQAIAAGEAPPAMWRCRCAEGKTVALPRPRGVIGESLSDVLLARRTCREFADEPISLDDLADMLFYAGGWLFREEVDYFGPVSYKCAPSPGGRQSIELYPIVQRCHGIEAGVYHYCVEHHRLAAISPVNAERFALEALMEQEYLADAAVVFLLTCVPERLLFKYKTARAYLNAHLEAGHFCQNLVLSATALGLGAFETAAVADSLINERLGIDGESEFVIYAAGAGPGVAEDSVETREVVLSPWLPDGHAGRWRGIRPRA